MRERGRKLLQWQTRGCDGDTERRCQRALTLATVPAGEAERKVIRGGNCQCSVRFLQLCAVVGSLQRYNCDGSGLVSGGYSAKSDAVNAAEPVPDRRHRAWHQPPTASKQFLFACIQWRRTARCIRSGMTCHTKIESVSCVKYGLSQDETKFYLKNATNKLAAA